MNILASVYACSPYDGSERAVGWNWLCELDKFHKIWALTSHRYKDDIEDYKSKHSEALQNTTFVYVEVPHWISFWHVGYGGERIYYMLWQRQALKIARNLINKVHFDLVHHITYVTCVLPTYMHKLGLPFLYGPVSGGENTPAIIGYPMSVKNKLVEGIRTASQVLFKSTPNFSKTMRNSSLILATTEETKSLIPVKYHKKVSIFQSIGLTEDIFYPEPQIKLNETCKILIAGRMIYWKGYELAILSFIKALEQGCKAELTVLGNTDDGSIDHKECLRSLCGQYLDKEIKFVSRVDHDKMKGFYDEFDVLLNCSLRDSGCFVVMEGMSRGLPVICVNTGGPRVNTTDEIAIKVKPDTLYKMITNTANAIDLLAGDKKLREKMGAAARKHALSNFTMSKRIDKMNEFYNLVVKK